MDKKAAMEIMTPDNPRWQEFGEGLAGPEGINVREGFPVDCDCLGWPKSTKILESMGNIDIEGTLRYFDECGGCCDCEVLLNVDPLELEDVDEWFGS